MKEYHNLPTAVLAYAAGIIDGEGCIRIGRYTNTKTGKIGYRGMIQVGMTNRLAIEWLKDNLGGNFYVGRTSYDRRKPCFNWIMRAADGAKLLSALLPYLIVKREHADLFIEFHKTVGKHLGRHGVPRLLNDKRRAMAVRSLELNAKGIAA